jgi:Septum formation
VKRLVLIFGTLVVVIAGLYGLSRLTAERTIPTTAPDNAPKAGSCWQVDEATAKQALPWPGISVDCNSEHTIEIFQIGQVGIDLIHRMDNAKGDDAKIVTNLLQAQVRRACVIQASVYLSGGWHNARLMVLASWIKPTGNGFYGCALAEVDGPGAQNFVHHKGSLKGSLKDGDAAPLAIGCVSRGAGDSTDALTYIPCAQPHDGEFVGSYTITPLDAPYDDGAVKNTAQRGCSEVAAKYLGIQGTGGRTDLNAGSVGPKTASDWLGSDQTYSCYAMAADGKLVGTIHNLGMKPLPR